MIVFYNNRRWVFEVIGRCGQWYALQSERACYAAGGHVTVCRTLKMEWCCWESVERSDTVDEAIWYFASSIFSALYSLVGKDSLHAKRREA